MFVSFHRCISDEKKIEEVEEKHGKQRVEWEEEKKVLLERQLEIDRLLYQNRIGRSMDA